jgi:multiple sugar transport system substrate-binding protein
MKFVKKSNLALLTVLLAGVSVNAKVTTINVWAWPTADNALKVIVPDFEKKYPDIKVKIVTMDYGAVHQKLLTTLAAGVGAPDVSAVEINHIAAFRAQKGLLVDLSRAPYFAIR